jgi:hypothetical protein
MSGGSLRARSTGCLRIAIHLRFEAMYVETLAELGIVGLASLALALSSGGVAAARACSRPAARNAARYVGYLVGGGVDGDWQITLVKPALLLVGVVRTS